MNGLQSNRPVSEVNYDGEPLLTTFQGEALRAPGTIYVGTDAAGLPIIERACIRTAVDEIGFEVEVSYPVGA